MWTTAVAISTIELFLMLAQQSAILMDRLPIELLSAIFVAGLPTLDSHNHAGTTRIDSQVLVGQLSLVCKAWRANAVACPELWAEIAVESDTTLETTARWLDRAKSRPLHIFVYLDYGDPKGDFQPCLELLHTKADQWSSFQMIGRWLSVEDVKMVLPPSLPNLIDASIDNPYHTHTFPPFCSTPKLRRFTLAGEDYAAFPFIDHTSLTRCTITEFISENEWRDQYQVFMATLTTGAPNLETLEFKTTVWEFVDKDSDPSPDLPWPVSKQLKSLILHGCHRRTIQHVLGHLNAPSLEVVHFVKLDLCGNLLEPLRLPCGSTFRESTLSDIRCFMDKVSNALNVEITRSALRFVTSCPGTLAGEGEEGYLGAFKDDFFWLYEHAKVSWTIKESSTRIQGSPPEALAQLMQLQGVSVPAT